MTRYLIETPHKDAECLKALDELAAQSPKLLAQCNLGCMSGIHTGWAVVEAGTESEARNMVPPSLRDRARYVKVETLTPEKIRSFHQ